MPEVLSNWIDSSRQSARDAFGEDSGVRIRDSGWLVGRAKTGVSVSHSESGEEIG